MASNSWIIGDNWSARPAPHEDGGNTHKDILRAWTLAASLVALAGIVLFGFSALVVLVISIVSAIVSDLVVGYVTRRPVIGGLSHAGLTGLLLGLTLPATVPWYVPMVGAFVAIVCGKGLFGGLGHYIWQPALVGRVVVQFIFYGFLSFNVDAAAGGLATSPVLKLDRVLVGDITASCEVDMAYYHGWFDAGGVQPAGAWNVDSWRMERPIQAMRRFAEGKLPSDDDLMFEPLLRDAMPPWQDTVVGVVPGGIGETCSLCLVVAGLYLIYRGFLRWQLPVAMLASAALAAAILPVEVWGTDGDYRWLPAIAAEQGRAVGVAYVLFHLTSGQLLLGAFLLAGDMIATPMRTRGQLVFAIGVGVLTVFMRLYGPLECACYWSILIMNFLVPAIDRRLRRPVLGMAPAITAAD